ncbi:MAG: hypothetical protein JWP02_3645 [Acidimicrobiales bacterium]|nr:hypothetical protein [Acidimicrobiales bacterium]
MSQTIDVPVRAVNRAVAIVLAVALCLVLAVAAFAAGRSSAPTTVVRNAPAAQSTPPAGQCHFGRAC